MQQQKMEKETNNQKQEIKKLRISFIRSIGFNKNTGSIFINCFAIENKIKIPLTLVLDKKQLYRILNEYKRIR